MNKGSNAFQTLEVAGLLFLNRILIMIDLTVITSDPQPVPNPVNHRPNISTATKLSKVGINLA